MTRVEFHPAAREELAGAARYYEIQQAGLGKRFALAVREAIQRIQEYPLVSGVVEPDVRRCRVLRFPYGVIYRVKPDRLQVIAVMHLHRRPGYWKSRSAGRQ